jgi:hypothetical protein
VNVPLKTRDRFRAMLEQPGAIERIFDASDHEAAFKPFWPEMLDFELPETWTTMGERA